MRDRFPLPPDLLGTSDLPITEVAHAVGYGHSAHFSEAFRRAFGLSPSHFRAGLG